MIRPTSKPWLRAASMLAVAVAAGTGAIFSATVPFVSHPVDTPPAVPDAVAHGDLDGDGAMDVVVASSADGTIAWYPGGGTGFGPRTVITSAAPGVTAIALVDLGGDARLDIVASSAGDPTIRWFENALPAWSEHTVFAGAFEVQAVVAADLNLDGDVDLVSASRHDPAAAPGDEVEIRQHVNLGDGTFATSEVFSFPDGSTQDAFDVAVADMDGDGDPDVVSALGDAVAWHENPGWQVHPVSADGAHTVAAHDLNADGDADIVAGLDDGRVVWFANTPGEAVPFAEHTLDNAVAGLTVVAHDLDMDGDTDLVAAQAFDADLGALVWYENVGGAFAPAAVIEPVRCLSVAVGDLDADGDPDAIGGFDAPSSPATIFRFENTGLHRSATFAFRSVIYNGQFSNDFTQRAEVADIDGDGDLDLVTGGADVRWHRNDGATVDPAEWDVFHIDTGTGAGHAVAVADIDKDGDLDVLSTSSTDHSVRVHFNDGTPAEIGDWDLQVVAVNALQASDIAAVDLNGDGDIDVVVAAENRNALLWYWNEGNGSLTPERIVTDAIVDPYTIVTADLDGDGDIDILGGSREDGEPILWFENRGSPTSAPARPIFDEADTVFGLGVADIDGDGDLDVVSTSSGVIRWHENDGSPKDDTGPWVTHEIYTALAFPYSLTVADVDRDGDPDVVTGWGNEVLWHSNDGAPGGPGGWTTRGIADAVSIADSVVVADLDADGDRDVIWTSTNRRSLRWNENRGGQFALATADLAPATAAPGCQDVALLGIDVIHNGRPGDVDLELARLELRLENAFMAPLSEADANGLIASIEVFRDDGSTIFERAADTPAAAVSPLALDDGNLTIEFADGDEAVRVAHGAPATFFVAVQVDAGAAALSPNRFRIVHRTGEAPASAAEQRDADVPLSLEFVADTASGVVQAGPDVDCDGVTDLQDNCRFEPNPDQTDTDGNQLGDLCDDDDDGDFILDAEDCAPLDPSLWSAPGDAGGLRFDRDGLGTTLEWDPPAVPGGFVHIYEILRSEQPDDFGAAASCLSPDEPTLTLALVPADPDSGLMFAYLVRAATDCGAGMVGTDSSGQPRIARDCP